MVFDPMATYPPDLLSQFSTADAFIERVECFLHSLENCQDLLGHTQPKTKIFPTIILTINIQQ